MPLDGSGNYTPVAPEFPAIPNTVIYAADFNQIILDIASALSQAIFRDGQAAFTQSQSMGGNKLTSLANGTVSGDAVNFGQVFTNPAFVASTVAGVTVSGTTLTLTVTLLDASGVTTVSLPAGTSIGGVSAAEIAYLNGVTSDVQTQLNAKSNLAGGNTFTGTQVMTADLASASIGVTQVIGDSSLKLATTQFVANTAMSAALPAQTGNAGKVVTTDGSVASFMSLSARHYFFGQLG